MKVACPDSSETVDVFDYYWGKQIACPCGDWHVGYEMTRTTEESE